MATESSAKASKPIAATAMERIAKEACDQTLVLAESYVHAQTEAWNGAIINKILESLVSAAAETSSKYKWAVNSTIIQHISDTPASGTGTQTTADPEQVATPPAEAASETNGGASAVGAGVGVSASRARRGLHSAAGAYWNNETDGMWSYKYDGGASKGMDVVISIIWVSV